MAVHATFHYYYNDIIKLLIVTQHYDTEYKDGCVPSVAPAESPLVSGGGPLSDCSLCLANHSYVDLTLVGIDTSDPGTIVRCITDLDTCCTGSQGDHRGHWYSLMVESWHHLVVIFTGVVVLRELPYVVGTMPWDHLVYIVVIFQLLLSMMMVTSQ